jgi:hypothetical protein
MYSKAKAYPGGMALTLVSDRKDHENQLYKNINDQLGTLLTKMNLPNMAVENAESLCLLQTAFDLTTVPTVVQFDLGDELTLKNAQIFMGVTSLSSLMASSAGV